VLLPPIPAPPAELLLVSPPDDPPEAPAELLLFPPELVVEPPALLDEPPLLALDELEPPELLLDWLPPALEPPTTDELVEL
jgi:hypothetical protein